MRWRVTIRSNAIDKIWNIRNQRHCNRCKFFLANLILHALHAKINTSFARFIAGRFILIRPYWNSNPFTLHRSQSLNRLICGYIHPGSSAARITDEQDTKGSDEKDARLFFFQVSWVRHRDIHLLTVGVETYTSDQRFVALHFPHTEDWALQVKYPQRRDSGTYECQVSTTPPIGHSMLLSVVGELYLSLCLFSSCFSPCQTASCWFHRNAEIHAISVCLLA